MTEPSGGGRSTEESDSQKKKPIVLLCIAVSLTGGLSLVGVDPARVDIRIQYVYRAVLALSAVLFLFWIRDRLEQRLLRRPIPFPRHKVDRINAAYLQLRAGGSGIKAYEAELFALAVTKPRRVRQRIVDTYVPERRQLQQSVKIEAQIPAAIWRTMRQPGQQGDTEIAPHADQSRRVVQHANSSPTPMVYFPVIVPFKGKLLDNFALSDANGAEVSILSYRESLELAAGTLHQILRELKKLAKEPDERQFRLAENIALEQMMRRRPETGPVIEGGEPVGWQEIDRLPAESSAADRVKSLAVQFSQMLVENFCIVATVMPDENGRIFLHYQQTLIPDLDLTDPPDTFGSKFLGRLRVALGTRPAEVTIGVQNATICQSYHLRVMVSDDLYVSNQTAIGFEELLKIRAADTPSRAHLRFRRRLGQPYAHFYSRYLPAPPKLTHGVSEAQEIPRIRFTFIEVPPGSLVRAVVASVSAAALIWLVGIINSSVSAPDTDAPAYLLTFPAAVAAWVGFDSPSRRLFEGTLRARLILIITAFTSLTAAGLFIAHKSIAPLRDDYWWNMPDNMSVLGIGDLSWAVLATIAVANAAYACFRYYVLTWHFTYYSTREQRNNDFIQRG